MLRVDQSGRKHVRRLESNISTPRFMASIIAFFDVRNVSSNSSDYSKFRLGLRKMAVEGRAAGRSLQLG